MESPKVILCVEDDSDTCELLKIFLQSAGYKFVSADTCEDALKLIREKGCFDLFIVDERLPDGDGISLSSRLKIHCPQTPIIFSSADVRQSLKDQALSAGARVFIEKPTELDLLAETIKRLIGTSPRSEDSAEASPEPITAD